MFDDDHDSELQPVVDCVYETEKGYIAYFGFKNGHDRQLTIPVGPKNFFSPEPADRQQPTEFAVGHHHFVFMVQFDEENFPTWHLVKKSATVSNKSPRCQFPTPTEVTPSPTEVTPSPTVVTPSQIAQDQTVSSPPQTRPSTIVVPIWIRIPTAPVSADAGVTPFPDNASNESKDSDFDSESENQKKQALKSLINIIVDLIFAAYIYVHLSQYLNSMNNSKSAKKQRKVIKR